MLDAALAKAIINKLGESGTPPEFGIEHFTIGLERYLRVVEDEYLRGILKYNLSSFKLVTGSYGGGKTHFLYSVRNLAWRNNFVVAYVSLNPTECPFDKLELVYKQIVTNLTPPMAEAELLKPWEKGIDAFMRLWFKDIRQKTNGDEKKLSAYLLTIKGMESSSFTNAVRSAFLNLMQDNEDGYESVLQWLKGEEITKEVRALHRISERIDKTTAFRMIRSLIQWINLIGFSGVIFLFDEAERGMSIASSRDKRRALDNLRQIVDECGNSRLPGAMFFYAVPDENLLLEGGGGVYEALKQRLRSAFSETNPVGVKVNLEALSITPQEFLLNLGLKLALIFEAAYNISFEESTLKKSVTALSEATLHYHELDIGYRRIFVVSMVELLQRLKNEPDRSLTKREAEQLLKLTSRRLEEHEAETIEHEEF
ncbi:MAG: BREX system ATP-binding domain-containing protein [candidate division WOR-3 bacterium]